MATGSTKTPSTIEALEGAIDMLTRIAKGVQYGRGEYVDRLRAYEAARDEHHRLENIARRNRAAIREMSHERRSA